MPIYQTAQYQIEASAVSEVAAAIEDFVRYVRENEPGTAMYSAWQQASDPTRFVHLFTFTDAAAHEAHGKSAAVKQFEAVYTPHLVGGPVVFTYYLEVATNT